MTKSQRNNSQHLESSGKCQLKPGSCHYPPRTELKGKRKTPPNAGGETHTAGGMVTPPWKTDIVLVMTHQFHF